MITIRHLAVVVATGALITSCGGSDDSATVTPATDPATTLPGPADAPFFTAALGAPVSGFDMPVDLAVRPGEPAQTFVVEQSGTIGLLEPDGRRGRTVADLTTSTRARGERGLLGLAFDSTGAVAYVNYTDLEGDTVIEAFDVGAEGDFDPSSRRIIYTLAQPYANHNGGELLLAPDGASLLVFTGDGGSADDPERLALDPNSQLGKIVQLDLSSDNPVPRTVASGLRNPWRASYDATTDRLWIADVGQNLWEEINAVAYSDLEGTSFGWSAFEGTVPFNDDQLSRHQALTAVEPIHTYPHENDDCSISGGFVYRGDAIAHTGTWYLFADFCSGIVRALCADENDMSCGVIELGKVPNAVGILPDASGEPWVLSIDGFLVPLLPGD